MSASDAAAAAAAALPSLTRKIDGALGLIAAHVEDGAGYVAWSGGKDSTAVVGLARTVVPDIPVVWFDSGLEFPETRDYIHGLAETWKLNLHVIPAVPDALTVLAQSGTWDHASLGPTGADSLHRVLVTDPSKVAHGMFGDAEMTGLRVDESAGRRILLAPARGRYTRVDGTRVCCPIWNWADMDVRGYLYRKEIPLNPVYGKLSALGVPIAAQRVGLVVDANGAEYGRFAWLRAGWPDLWAQMCEALPRLKEWR